MPATINPIRKALLKKELMNPKNSVKDSLLKAGYSPITAHNSTNVKAVKVCMQEIATDIKKTITVEYILSELNRIAKLAEDDKDYSAVIRAKELLGKWLAMFTDKTEPSTIENITMQFSVDRLQLIQIQSPTTPTT